MQNHVTRSSLYIWLALAGLTLVGCDRTPLEQKLVSADPELRNTALQKLADFSADKQKSFATKLIAYLKSEDTLVASRATNAFVVIGEPSVETLTGLVTDPDVFVRLNAITALGDIGPAAKSATPAIETALKDSHPLVREEAAFALQKINPSPARS